MKAGDTAATPSQLIQTEIKIYNLINSFNLIENGEQHEIMNIKFILYS